MYSQNRT